ncbi:MAG: ATP-binding protein [Candidatus Aenigmatarchaeota archaeon]
MNLHRSAVNFQNLITDLADMYTDPVPEVILTELIANSLDAKASKIEISYDSKNMTLIVEDNGSGMSKDQFYEYHDLAAGLKEKGTGIGFAGLGAKISFNVASRVYTETISDNFQGASNWYLKSKKELVWEESKKVNRLSHQGTRVEIWFRDDPSTHFGSADFIFGSTPTLESLLLKHYLPLFDLSFLETYEKIEVYSNKMRFFVNGAEIKPFNLEEKFNLKKTIRFFLETKSKRYGWGILGLSSCDYPFGEERVGVGISVYGKLIKHDFFGQFPTENISKIFGIIEVPLFINFLNTSKNDFIRSRSTAKKFSQLYEPAKKKFKEWLEKTGIKTIETVHTEDAVKLEQEVNKLARELPEILQLFGLKSQGAVHIKNTFGETNVIEVSGSEITFPIGNGESSKEAGFLDSGVQNGQALQENKNGSTRASPISRSKKTGLRISFMELSGDNRLAWLETNTVIINISHPSYVKIKSNNQARKLHNIFAIAIVIERELKKANLIDEDESFIEKMMSAWGKL